MDYEVEAELYNDIGAAVVEQIGSVETKILIYVEMKEDNFGCVIRYLDNETDHVRGVFANDQVSNSIDKVRSYLLNDSSKKLWKSMEYSIDYGAVNISISYDGIDKDIPIWERSLAIVEKYFPGKPFMPD